MTKSTKIIIPLLLAFVLLAAGSAPFLAEAAGRNKGLDKIGFNMGNKNNINKGVKATSTINWQVQRTAVDKALASADYNAWVTAVGAKSPLATKITAINFPKLVEIYNLRKQIEAKMTELGLTLGEGNGMMNCKGGLGLGEHKVGAGTCPMAGQGGCKGAGEHKVGAGTCPMASHGGCAGTGAGGCGCGLKK